MKFPLSAALLLSAWSLIGVAGAQEVFINELHYDNAGTDADEGIEIAGPAGTDLSAYDLVLHNGGNGAAYGTKALSGIIPDEGGSGFGAVWFGYASGGIQNGNPDGVVLVKHAGNAVVHMIAYGGPLTATNGPAQGLVLPDIGVRETTTTPAGQTLQLRGAGKTAADFTWSGPVARSQGLINAGQTFTGGGGSGGGITFSPAMVTEGAGATATLTLSPPPAAPVVMNLTVMPPLAVAFPATVTVPATGSVSFEVQALTDGEPDGFQNAVLTAGTTTGSPVTAAGTLRIIDADRPARSGPGVLRVATLNVRLGVDAPGSAEFNAVREVVERVSPDVLLLQEVSDAGNFADIRALLAQAGFPTDAAHLSISGDTFAGQAYVSGDFGTGECVVTASRYPIKRTVQIGRGVAGRKELTRFPLFTGIDLPDLPGAEDLRVVNVHLKASTGDADNFRKALECYRLREFLTQQGLSAASDNLIVGGDFNAIDFNYQPATSYNTAINPTAFTFQDGSKLPTTFQLGSDLTAGSGVTLPYRIFPHQGMNPAGLFAPELFQADGVTEPTFNLFPARYDYLFFPQRLLAAGAVRGEVYNSRLEPQADGLPKRRTLPAPELSETASDHYLTFADVNLSPLPALKLTVSPTERDESSSAAPPVATVSLTPAPAAPVTAHLGVWRDERVSFGVESVVLTPSNPSAQVPVMVPFSPLVEPRRSVSLSAAAEGFAPAFAALTLRSPEAAGLLVISQYVEPPAATSPPDINTPRAVELFNASGAPIDLARAQLQLRRCTNGAVTFSVMGRVAEILPDDSPALLPAGAVLVVGEAAVGDALVAAGLLPAPAESFASATAHTLYCNAAGRAVFLKGSGLDFNGDDALEVVLDGLRCDVFGRIGQDPGTAWTGGAGNPSTADQNLALRPEIVTGSGGFTQPGTRFVTVSAGNSLTGIGVPPVITDRYSAWATTAGLSGTGRAPNSDPDHDGRLNLTEFAEGTNPAKTDSSGLSLHADGKISLTTVNADSWLNLSWERSSDVSAWTASPEVAGTPEGAEKTLWQWAPGPTAARGFWRLRVSRP
ncbi:MAG: endonuclease/exonuclease/phosphatase family protein [Verrucomicrobiota bacterium]